MCLQEGMLTSECAERNGHLVRFSKQTSLSESEGRVGCLGCLQRDGHFVGLQEGMVT